MKALSKSSVTSQSANSIVAASYIKPKSNAETSPSTEIVTVATFPSTVISDVYEHFVKASYSVVAASPVETASPVVSANVIALEAITIAAASADAIIFFVVFFIFLFPSFL